MGPIMMPMPHTAMARPRWPIGKISHRMAWDSGIKGPPPIPWNTRAMMRKVRLGASPEKKELTVKIVVQIRKNRRRPM